MCGLFGFSDPANLLNEGQRNRLINHLARASEIRGTDATGIAAVKSGEMLIFKRARPARKLHLCVPRGAVHVMGHVRMATQGAAAKNYNNHPFRGEHTDSSFAPAHNGVIYNEVELKAAYALPDDRIETDSYVAVQALEALGNTSLDSVQEMCEQLEGTFALSILTDQNALYLVRGNNPLSVWYYESLGLYVYASTAAILEDAIKEIAELKHRSCQKIHLEEGDIFCIDAYGNTTQGTFDTGNIWKYTFNSVWNSAAWDDAIWDDRDFLHPHRNNTRNAQRSELRMTAHNMGFDREDIEVLLGYGYSEDEVAALLCDDDAFRYALADMCYEGLCY